MKQSAADGKTNNSSDSSSKSDIDNNNTIIINYNNNKKINNKSLTQSINTINSTSDFNFGAVGDQDCSSETDDTIDNIIKQDPELVLALEIYRIMIKLNAGQS